MKVLGFHHLAIQAHDVELVTRFYREVLGLPEQARHHRDDGSLRSVWLSLPDGFLAIEHASGPPEDRQFRSPRPGLHLLALRIDAHQRAAFAEELALAGVELVHQTRWTLYFLDPEGNRIALSHHPHDAR